MTVSILVGDVRDKLRSLPADSFDCVVTSPPYWGLRKYIAAGAPEEKFEIGREPTLGEHLAIMVDVFREVRRVLKPSGTLWLNYGDAYANNASTSQIPRADQGNGSGAFRIPGQEHVDARRAEPNRLTKMKQDGLKHKDLMMIPNRLAIALQDDGWWVRSEIIWGKTNPMPDSVRDRPGTAHEKIFLLSKAARYWYDSEAVRFDLQPKTFTVNGTERNDTEDDGTGKVFKANIARTMPIRAPRKAPAGRMDPRHEDHINHTGINATPRGEGRGLRNYEPAPLAAWEMATRPFSEAHFATFPPELVERCLKAGCPKGGTVLDPFGGAGTTALVADQMQLDCTIIELNPDYVHIAARRIESDRGAIQNTLDPLQIDLLAGAA